MQSTIAITSAGGGVYSEDQWSPGGGRNRLEYRTNTGATPIPDIQGRRLTTCTLLTSCR